jgi:large subunit ribosomal protein L13
VDCGDYVIVTNARKVKVTGRKEEQLVYRKHTMFAGGLKETSYKDMMVKKPDEVRILLLFTLARMLKTLSPY